MFNHNQSSLTSIRRTSRRPLLQSPAQGGQYSPNLPQASSNSNLQEFRTQGTIWTGESNVQPPPNSAQGTFATPYYPLGTIPSIGTGPTTINGPAIIIPPVAVNGVGGHVAGQSQQHSSSTNSNSNCSMSPSTSMTIEDRRASIGSIDLTTPPPPPPELSAKDNNSDCATPMQSDDINSKTETFEQLKVQNTNLLSILKHKDERYQKLQSDCKAVISRKDYYKKENTQLQSRIIGLQAKADKKMINNFLEDDSMDLEIDEDSEKNKMIADLKEEINGLKLQKDDFEEKMNNAIDAEAIVNSNCVQLRAELASKEAQISSLEQHMDQFFSANNSEKGFSDTFLSRVLLENQKMEKMVSELSAQCDLVMEEFNL